MIKIKIGKIEKDLEDANESWINQEIGRLRKSGQTICVRLRIQTNYLVLPHDIGKVLLRL